MILYHGSYIKIEKPDIQYSRNELDFGKGFYLTSIEEQAILWAKRYIKTKNAAMVNAYVFDENAMNDYNVLQFEGYTKEWLDFVANCRKGIQNEKNDIIIGCIANDRIFNTTELYFKGLIGIDVAIDRLRFEKPNNQICIKNQDILDKKLHFKEVKSYVG